MDSEGKLFIGGISWKTTEERLKDYFRRFGDVLQVEIKKDKMTGRLRGFGFIVFADPAVADRVLLEKHNIDGRMVEAKKAISRDEQHSISIARSNTVGNGSRVQSRTKKIFVGGLAATVTENDMRNYFQQFGTITNAVVKFDPTTQAPRGFGFIIYDSENAVDLVLQNPFHQLNGKTVEVKPAIPRMFSGCHFGLPASASREGNLVASNAHVFNSTPVPPVNNSYGYSSYGANGYNTANYGSGAGYGAAFNGGSYNNNTFMNNNPTYVGFPNSYGVPISYVGVPISYGVPISFGAAQVDNGQSNGSDARYAAQNGGYETGFAPHG